MLGDVERRRAVRVEAQDLKGTPVLKLKLGGWEAVLFQPEFDPLLPAAAACWGPGPSEARPPSRALAVGVSRRGGGRGGVPAGGETEAPRGAPRPGPGPRAQRAGPPRAPLSCRAQPCPSLVRRPPRRAGPGRGGGAPGVLVRT